MIEAVVRGYHVYKKVWCWKGAILHERSGELSRSVCCSSGKIMCNHQ